MVKTSINLLTTYKHISMLCKTIFMKYIIQ